MEFLNLFLQTQVAKFQLLLRVSIYFETSNIWICNFRPKVTMKLTYAERVLTSLLDKTDHEVEAIVQIKFGIL